VCVHIPYSRADLYNVIAIRQLRTFDDVMKSAGKCPDSLGCEICKPAIASILSSLFNPHLMDKEYHELQETNDRFLANIQRNGTFSVVPRVPGGEITADKLIAIGQVAKKYNLYCKITGGQRIDMFGARKQDLLDIWTELVDAGMESGHAYAKSLRTVKVRFILKSMQTELTEFRVVLEQPGADSASETALEWLSAWSNGIRVSELHTSSRVLSLAVSESVPKLKTRSE
jgi:NAD(P)H-nitrite reductase large subunit